MDQADLFPAAGSKCRKFHDRLLMCFDKVYDPTNRRDRRSHFPMSPSISAARQSSKTSALTSSRANSSAMSARRVVARPPRLAACGRIISANRRHRELRRQAGADAAARYRHRISGLRRGASHVASSWKAARLAVRRREVAWRHRLFDRACDLRCREAALEMAVERPSSRSCHRTASKRAIWGARPRNNEIRVASPLPASRCFGGPRRPNLP